MRLLITGGCGFLGSNLAAHAIGRGDAVWIFDSLRREGSVANLEWLKGRGKFEFLHGDVRNGNDVRRAVEAAKPEGVFHLAGQVAMTTSIADPRMDFEVNAGGTFHLLEAVRALAPEARVVYSSTNKVYGDLEQFSYRETATRYECVDKPAGFDELVGLEFHSPYGCSKGAADQYVLDYARIFGLDTMVFRHSSMYGGRQFATYDQGWVGWFCGLALESKAGRLLKPFSISGSGKQVRDVLHADDMVSLYYAALEAAPAAARGHAFNIGGGMGNSLSLLELFKLLEELAGAPMKFVSGPPRESDQKVFVADLAKATRLLKWAPKVGKKDGLKRMLDWLARDK